MVEKKLQSSTDGNIQKWQDFNTELIFSLDLITYNNANVMIREFIELEMYLICEYHVKEREKNLMFYSQECLRQYLNQNLDVSFKILIFIKMKFILEIIKGGHIIVTQFLFWWNN